MNRQRQKHPSKFLWWIKNRLRDLDRRIKKLENHKHVYSVSIRILQMAIGDIEAGSTGNFSAQLELNGAPIALPSGSTFAWTASDATVTFAVSADTTSAVVTVPAGDTGTSVTITATTTDPNGNSVSGNVTVALTPAPQVFTVTVTQTA